MSNRNIPSAGEFYRHFKGNLYQIIGVAKHSETLEEMVVYQALYGDYGLYTRPLEMFVSKVDREKYPETAQEYRFEKVIPEAIADSGTKQRTAEASKTENTDYKAQEKTTVEHPVVSVAEEEYVREEILQFLDAEGAAEKLDVLRKLRKNMDENLLTTIELSLDLLPDERESMERRYELVEQTLEKRVRFEGGRLR